MYWSNEERMKLFDKWAQSHGEADDILALATLAVELLAVRGGPMTAEQVAALFAMPWCANSIGSNVVQQHISALGARNAVLEAERNATLVALGGHDDEVPAVRAEAVMERLSAAEDGNRELVRRAQQAESELEAIKGFHRGAVRVGKEMKDRAEAAEARCATLSAAGQVLNAHVDKAVCVMDNVRVTDSGTVVLSGPGAYFPCSQTCTHDDAATPGHPERVKERSEAVIQAATRTEDAASTDGHARGYNEGADAMRAACLEAVRTRLEVMGALDVYGAVKAAIEGAVP